MSGDPGDLSRLADLALPPAVSFWPPAAGIWIVGGAAVAMLAVSGWRALRRYRADAYLRAAAAELDAVTAATKPGERDGAETVSAILKRAAMVAYGRERVAALTGAAWASFIAETAPAGAPTDALPAKLAGLFAGPDASGADRAGAVLSQARSWLRGQRGRAGRA